jgi:hypothetical protein
MYFTETSMSCQRSFDRSITIFTLTAGLVACGGSNTAMAPASQAAASTPSETIIQDDVCETDTWAVAPNCKQGQKVVFLPRTFGNEQLPVVFASLNCDLRYFVALTNGAVTCIYLHRQKKEKPAAAASGASAP